MKIIMLAAGRGERLRPLTDKIPKPLIEVAGRPIIEHILDSMIKLPDAKIVIVVGYLGDQIVKRLGSRYRGVKISYIFQEETLGTGHATLLARKFIGSDPFVLYLADTYIVDDLEKITEKLAKGKGSRIVVSRVSKDKALNSGQVILSDGKVIDMAEKPAKLLSDVVAAGMYYFYPQILEYLQRLSDGKTLELTNGIRELLKHEKVEAVWAKTFIDIGTRAGLKAANDFLKGKTVAE
jgi:dTDP-glucose pyrophosphorylase